MISIFLNSDAEENCDVSKSGSKKRDSLFLNNGWRVMA
jgi:hypothetical protein